MPQLWPCSLKKRLYRPWPTGRGRGVIQSSAQGFLGTLRHETKGSGTPSHLARYLDTNLDNSTMLPLVSLNNSMFEYSRTC